MRDKYIQAQLPEVSRRPAEDTLKLAKCAECSETRLKGKHFN